jgi:hypothetical protein
MQFANNFNAMKSTLDGAFKQYDINKASKADYFGDDGVTPLEGDALMQAKNNALAGVYEKWGDAEGALNLRTKGAELEGLMRTNRIGAATEDDQIYIQGAGARAKLDSGIAASRASAAASGASARFNNLRADAEQSRIAQQNELTRVINDIGQQEFATKQEENEYAVNALRTADLPPALRQQGMEAFMKFGSDTVALEAATLARQAGEAVTQGLPGFQNFYNENIADGFKLDTVQADDGSVAAYAVRTDADGNEVRNQIYAAQGDDANIQVLNYLYQQVRDPSNILGAAVDNLAYRTSQAGLAQTQANTGNLVSQTNYRDGAQTDQTNADTANTRSQTSFREGPERDMYEANIDNVRSQITARGISSNLDNKRIELIAEQITTSQIDRDPSRPLSRTEVESEVADLVTKMSQLNMSEEEITESVRVLRNSLNQGSGITIERVQ